MTYCTILRLVGIHSLNIKRGFFYFWIFSSTRSNTGRNIKRVIKIWSKEGTFHLYIIVWWGWKTSYCLMFTWGGCIFFLIKVRTCTLISRLFDSVKITNLLAIYRRESLPIGSKLFRLCPLNRVLWIILGIHWHFTFSVLTLNCLTLKYIYNVRRWWYILKIMRLRQWRVNIICYT